MIRQIRMDILAIEAIAIIHLGPTHAGKFRPSCLEHVHRPVSLW